MQAITVTHRNLQACTCESPVCPLSHAPAAHLERPGLHRAIVARIASTRRHAEPVRPALLSTSAPQVWRAS